MGYRQRWLVIFVATPNDKNLPFINSNAIQVALKLIIYFIFEEDVQNWDIQMYLCMWGE